MRKPRRRSAPKGCPLKWQSGGCHCVFGELEHGMPVRILGLLKLCLGRVTQQCRHPPANSTSMTPPPRCPPGSSAFTCTQTWSSHAFLETPESPPTTSASSQSTCGSGSPETPSDIGSLSSSAACAATVSRSAARSPADYGPTVPHARRRHYGTSTSAPCSLHAPPLLCFEATLSRARHTQPLLVSRWRMELQHGSECVTRTSPMRLKPSSQLPRQALPRRLCAEMLEAL